MEQIDPIISGSSGPIKYAVKNHGAVKDAAATKVVGTMPFKALHPFPQMQTIKNGDIKVKIHWIVTTLPANGVKSVPVTDARVTVGTPTEPNAVGVEFTTRQPSTALIGSSPIAASIDAGIATAVPKPAMPSIKFPNPHPMSNARTRLSLETPASIFFTDSIAPVFKVRL